MRALSNADDGNIDGMQEQLGVAEMFSRIHLRFQLVEKMDFPPVGIGCLLYNQCSMREEVAEREWVTSFDILLEITWSIMHMSTSTNDVYR